MSMGARLELRQSQSLVMTPQLRQAIKLLQFSNLDVAAFVEEELERNPLLEREDADADGAPEPNGADAEAPIAAEPDTADLVQADSLPSEAAAPLDCEEDRFDSGGPGDGIARATAAAPDDDANPWENLAADRPSLRDHLGEQLRLNIEDRTERLIGAHLIALLDAAGRLGAEPAEIARALGTTEAAVEAVRRRMLQFDPPGLFARSLAECLEAQLRDKNRFDPAMAALLDNLELLARRDMRQLADLCGVDREDLADMVAELRALDPKPGAGWLEAPLPPVVPDVLMRAGPGGDWLLELNPETMPRVIVNEGLCARVRAGARNGAAAEARGFVAEQLANANWLVKSLRQRAQTILKVSSELVVRQDGFFRHGVSHLRPLILRDIADAVGLHESTVSRVTANKYIATPRGVLELKYFFTTAIAGSDGESHSAEAIRHRIRALVGAETAADILSDDAIVSALRTEGVDIARRTVAKYREALRIPSSVQRRREKAVPA